MDKPRLSVIVPVYKVENYLRDCIDSILNQTFTDFELILVDDGSPDQCGKICDEYAALDKRVRVIHKSNGGLSDARNKGIDASKGDIIGFVDSDDKISDDMYQKMIQYMDDHQLDIVCADTYVVKNGKETFRPRFREDKLFSRMEALREILTDSLDNAAWNKIYKREVIGDIRFPMGRIYEDVATVYRFIGNSEKVGYICKPFYYYFKRKGSIIDTSFNMKGRYDRFCSYQERLLFAEKLKLNCVDDCKAQVLEEALNVLTVHYASDESEKSEKCMSVTAYIDSNANQISKARLRFKHRVLILCYQYYVPLYKLYAKLSAGAKKVRR